MYAPAPSVRIARRRGSGRSALGCTSSSPVGGGREARRTPWTSWTRPPARPWRPHGSPTPPTSTPPWRPPRAAFPAWSGAPPVERSAALTRLAAALEARGDELARTESRQTGKPIRLSTGFDVPGTIDNVAFFAGAARNLEGKSAGEYSGDHTSLVRREAIGVVGSVAPWNYPLQMAGWKVLPAIAAGNTIVLKPAEITPLTSLLLADACQEAGIPDGVVNVLTGAGPVAGEALVVPPATSTWCRSPGRARSAAG